MPMAIPLIAAAGTAAAGYAAATAVGATMASMVVGGVMMAGAAMTAVGAITGNQRLSQFGAIASLAGGVAGFATGAWDATASTLAEQSAKEGAVAFEHSAASYGGEAGMAAANSSASASGSALTSSEFAGLDGTGAVPAGQSFSASTTPGAVQPTMTAQPTVTPAATPTNVTGVPTPSVPNPSAGLTKPAIPVNDGDTGILGSIKGAIKWAGATPENSRLVQSGMGMLTAAGMSYAQQEAMKEQMELNEQARLRAQQRISDSVKGIKAPVYQRQGG